MLTVGGFATPGVYCGEVGSAGSEPLEGCLAGQQPRSPRRTKLVASFAGMVAESRTTGSSVSLRRRSVASNGGDR